MTPQRIQLSRRKGWRKPEGAIVVARPSRWGNPFQLSHFPRNLTVALYSDMIQGIWRPTLLAGCSDEYYRLAHVARSFWLLRLGWRHPHEAARAELGGRDLACWCRIGEPCHADVLLELANPSVVVSPTQDTP